MKVIRDQIKSMPKVNKIIFIFLCISFLGSFFPWFYFGDGEAFIFTGWNYFSLLGIGLVPSFILIVKNKRNKQIHIMNLIALLFTPLSCIHLFFTWHYTTITGEYSFMISYNTTHYGFYITFISSLIAMIIYTINLIIVSWKKL